MQSILPSNIIEKTIQWGIAHSIMIKNCKKYTNITFIDVKLNLCDFLVDLIKVHCPVPSGIYQIKSGTDTVPNLLWSVSNRLYSVSLLLFYFIGSVLWQDYCVQRGMRANEVHCPVPSGIYQIKSGTDTVPNLLWSVSNRLYSVSLLLFYFIGSVLWQDYCVQRGMRANDVCN